MDFHEFFRICQVWCKDQPETFLMMLHVAPWIQDLFFNILDPLGARRFARSGWFLLFLLCVYIYVNDTLWYPINYLTHFTPQIAFYVYQVLLQFINVVLTIGIVLILSMLMNGLQNHTAWFMYINCAFFPSFAEYVQMYTSLLTIYGTTDLTCVYFLLVNLKVSIYERW